MYALLYQSRARPGLRARDLNAIVRLAEARNPAIGVTGLMLYGELEMLPGMPGEFVQWLEGPEQAVETLFAHIESDSRHLDVEVLGRGPGLGRGAIRQGPDGRLFGSWAMGLVRLAELPATLAGFLAFASDWGGPARGAGPRNPSSDAS